MNPNRKFLIAMLAAAAAAPAQAQDAVRGAKLFADTGKVIGKPVPACVSCHGDVAALRTMIANRGGRTDDVRELARWLAAVFAGAQPNALNAKLQFRDVLTLTDLDDLAAYLAQAVRAQADSPRQLARRD